MAWRDGVNGWFGEVDRKLAVHPLDEKRAKDGIREAKTSGDTYEDVEKEVVYNCYKRVALANLAQHLEEQITRLKKLWG